MTREEFITEVAVAQRKLNDLLMGAHQQNVTYSLEISGACCVHDDDRTVIGVTIFDRKPLYKSDGVP